MLQASKWTELQPTKSTYYCSRHRYDGYVLAHKHKSNRKRTIKDLAKFRQSSSGSKEKAPKIGIFSSFGTRHRHPNVHV